MTVTYVLAENGTPYRRDPETGQLQPLRNDRSGKAIRAMLQLCGLAVPIPEENS